MFEGKLGRQAGRQLTPGETSRLGSFRTLTTRINQQQTNLDKGESWELYVKDEGGKVTGTIPITQGMVNVWRHTANSLYEGFRPNQPLKEAAQEVIFEATKDRKSAEELKKTEITVLTDLWQKGENL